MAEVEQAPLPQRNSGAQAAAESNTSTGAKGNAGAGNNSANTNGNQNGAANAGPNSSTPKNRRGGGGGGFRGGRGNNRNFANRNNNQQGRNFNKASNPKQMNNDVSTSNSTNANNTTNNNNTTVNEERRHNSFKKNDDYQIFQKLKQFVGPTYDLQPIDHQEIKFSNRNRLYVGNLTNDVTENDLKEMFAPFGEIAEAFINKEKNFAFVKVDFRVNAEKAKRELDGTVRKGRNIRVRFAPNATSVKVLNLTPMVSNELLYRSFEIFGPVERAIVITDDRGKSAGEGIVEFSRKSSALSAIRFCNDRCLFLTASLRPCVVELFEQIDDTDGYPEKSIMNRKNNDFLKSRELGPRFAEPGSFEHEYGTRWKQMHENFVQKKEALKRELMNDIEKLDAQMEYARFEHETELLREQLRIREQDRSRQKVEWEMKERNVEEQRNRESELMRRANEDMQMKMHRQDEELRRRQQENTLFMQAQQLNSILDQQERRDFTRRGDNFDVPQHQGGMGGGNHFNRQSRYDEQQQQQQQHHHHQQQQQPQQQQQHPQQQQNHLQQGGGGGMVHVGNHHQGGGGVGGGNGGGNMRNMQRQWDRRGDDNNFPNKRRRY